MVHQARRKVRNFQWYLYEQAHQRAVQRGYPHSQLLKQYSDNFQNDLPDRFETTQIQTLLEAIQRSSVTLYGDFHTLKQSPRGLLRLLTEYGKRFPDDTLTLGLECFTSDHNLLLEQYLTGFLSEIDLLLQTKWLDRWGFPFVYYKGLLDIAQLNRWNVIGINTPQTATLQERDAHAAGELSSRLHTDGAERLVCLIGESHLAQGHLPLALKSRLAGRDLEVLRIVNNIEPYYFALCPSHSHRSTEYLMLSEDYYCVLNAPPWLKWKSYSLWEERRDSEEFDCDEDDLYTEDSIDVDFYFEDFCKNLVEIYGLSLSSHQLSNFSVCIVEDLKELPPQADGQPLDSGQLAILLENLSKFGFYFDERSHVVYLAELSLNKLAESSGDFVFSTWLAASKMRFEKEHYFAKKIYLAALAMISSKILNPRRKTQDFRFSSSQKNHAFTCQADRAIQQWWKALHRDGVETSLNLLRGVYLKTPTAKLELLAKDIGRSLGSHYYDHVFHQFEDFSLISILYSKTFVAQQDIWDRLQEMSKVCIEFERRKHA